MKKVKQYGFAPLETLLILVIIAIVAFTAWYVFHTKGNTDTTYGNTANTQANTPATAKKSTSTTSKTSTAANVIQTKTDSQGVKYLADANGKTLYTYNQDSANTSNCTGSCLTTWPPYRPASSSASLPTNVGTMTRSDGTTQYTYKKMPLYYYTGDTKAGDTNGSGINGFSLAKP